MQLLFESRKEIQRCEYQISSTEEHRENLTSNFDLTLLVPHFIDRNIIIIHPVGYLAYKTCFDWLLSKPSQAAAHIQWHDRLQHRVDSTRQGVVCFSRHRIHTTSRLPKTFIKIDIIGLLVSLEAYFMTYEYS